uniref:Uncharacterized protein n=2 Tax=Odontella aurita TaxID=265563 RepID=A0A7S4HY26_9STRA
MAAAAMMNNNDIPQKTATAYDSVYESVRAQADATLRALRARSEGGGIIIDFPPAAAADDASTSTTMAAAATMMNDIPQKTATAYDSVYESVRAQADATLRALRARSEGAAGAVANDAFSAPATTMVTSAPEVPGNILADRAAVAAAMTTAADDSAAYDAVRAQADEALRAFRARSAEGAAAAAGGASPPLQTTPPPQASNAMADSMRQGGNHNPFGGLPPPPPPTEAFSSGPAATAMSAPQVPPPPPPPGASIPPVPPAAAQAQSTMPQGAGANIPPLPRGDASFVPDAPRNYISPDPGGGASGMLSRDPLPPPRSAVPGGGGANSGFATPGTEYVQPAGGGNAISPDHVGVGQFSAAPPRAGGGENNALVSPDPGDPLPRSAPPEAVNGIPTTTTTQTAMPEAASPLPDQSVQPQQQPQPPAPPRVADAPPVPNAAAQPAPEAPNAFPGSASRTAPSSVEAANVGPAPGATQAAPEAPSSAALPGPKAQFPPGGGNVPPGPESPTVPESSSSAALPGPTGTTAQTLPEAGNVPPGQAMQAMPEAATAVPAPAAQTVPDAVSALPPPPATSAVPEAASALPAPKAKFLLEDGNILPPASPTNPPSGGNALSESADSLSERMHEMTDSAARTLSETTHNLMDSAAKITAETANVASTVDHGLSDATARTIAGATNTYVVPTAKTLSVSGDMAPTFFAYLQENAGPAVLEFLRERSPPVAEAAKEIAAAAIAEAKAIYELPARALEQLPPFPADMFAQVARDVTSVLQSGGGFDDLLRALNVQELGMWYALPLGGILILSAICNSLIEAGNRSDTAGRQDAVRVLADEVKELRGYSETTKEEYTNLMKELESLRKQQERSIEVERSLRKELTETTRRLESTKAELEKRRGVEKELRDELTKMGELRSSGPGAGGKKELRAALAATEEQLEATEEQLEATEEQLEATKAELEQRYGIEKDLKLQLARATLSETRKKLEDAETELEERYDVENNLKARLVRGGGGSPEDSSAMPAEKRQRWFSAGRAPERKVETERTPSR